MNVLERFHLVLKRANQADSLKRNTGLSGILLMGIGGIIGSGIFVLTGHAASTSAGPAIVLSFVIAGAVALLAALCYATAAQIAPVAGGAFSYSYIALGELTGWFVGWDLQLEYLVGNSLIGIGWSSYLQAFLIDTFGIGLPATLCESPVGWDVSSQTFYLTGSYVNVPAFAIMLALTGVLCLGLRETTRVNTVVVTLKLSVLILFIAFVSPLITSQNLTPFIPPNTGKFGDFGWSGVLKGAGLVFFCFVGFDALATSGQELKNPQKTLPRAMFISLAVCTCLYVAVAFVLTGIVSYKNLAVGNPLTVAVHNTPYDWLTWLVGGGALVGLTSSISLGLMAHPRICLAMAQNRLLPKQFAQTSRKYGAPVFGTLVCGCLTALIAGFAPLQVLNELVSVGTLVGFAAVSLSVIVFNRSPLKAKITTQRPLLAWCSLIICIALLMISGLHALIRIVAWFAIGIPIYAFQRRQRM